MSHSLADHTLHPALTLALVSACGASAPPAAPTVEQSTVHPGPATTVIARENHNWEQLNPARGDASPMAATLWGDRNGTEPTGFLVRFVDGFESPPHIHNVSYRGVVISGEIHNAHPDADRSWMPVGTFWTQPKGAVHITAAKGVENIAFIEIDEAPYLVRPVEEAFPSDETARLLTASALDWTTESKPRVSVLWGNPNAHEPSGLLLQLDHGHVGTIHSRGVGFRAIVVEGNLSHSGVALGPGSYIHAADPIDVSCVGNVECLLYVLTEAPFAVTEPGH